MSVDAGTISSQVRIDLAKLESDVSAVNSQMRSIGSTSETQAAASQQAWSSSFNATKLAGVAAFVAISKAIKDTISVSSDFEQTMANVQSVAKGTPEQFNKLNEAAKEAGETTRFTASQAAGALYSLASAGYSATQSVDSLNGVLLLAGSTQSDLSATANTVVATLKQYNLEASQAGDVANIFAAAIGNSMATMDKLTASMTTAGPVAAAMGRSVEETVGTLEALYDAGYQGERAGNALKAALGALASESDPTTQKLLKLGLEFEKLNPATNKLADVFGYLAESGITAGQVMDAFGARMGGQVLSLMNTGRTALEKYTAAVTDTDAATEMYAIQNDTLAGSVDRLKSAYESVQIEMSENFNPALRKLVDIGTTLLKTFNALPAPIKTFTGILLAGIPIVTGATIAVRALGTAIGAIGGPIALAVTAVAGITAAVQGAVTVFGKVKETKIQKEFGDLAEQLGVTADEAKRLKDNADLAGITDVRKLKDLQDEFGMTDDAMELFMSTINRVSLSGGSVVDAMERWSEVFGLSVEQVYKLALANKNLGASDRTLISSWLYAIEVGKKQLEQREKEKEGIEDVMALHRLNAADVVNRAKETQAAVNQESATRQKALDKYTAKMKLIDEKVKLGVLTEQDANKQKATATETYLDALVGLNKGYVNVDDEIKKIAADLKGYTKAEQDAKDADSAATKKKQELEQANKQLAESTKSITIQTEALSGSQKDQIEVQRRQALAQAEASGASDEAIQKNKDAINAYYDVLQSTDAQNTLKDYKEKLEDIGVTTEQGIQLERKRALASAEASGKSKDEIKKLTDAINTYYDALLQGQQLDPLNAYNKTLSQIDAKEKAGALTAKEAASNRAQAAKSYLDAMLSVDSTVVDTSESVQKASDDLKKYTKAEQDATEADEAAKEAKRKLDNANKQMARSTLDYQNKLASLGDITQDTIEKNRQLAIQQAKTSGANDKEIQDNIDSINAYYDAVQQNDTEKTLEDYKQKLDDIGKSSRDLIKDERDRALASVDASGKSADEIEKLKDAINDYYDKLLKQDKIDSMVSSFKTAFTQISSYSDATGDLVSAIYDKMIANIQREEEEALRAAGVSDDTALESAQKELDAAKETADESIAAIQKKLDAALAAGDEQAAAALQAQIDQEKANQQETIDEKQKAVDKAQIEQDYEKKISDMQYKQELWSWRLKLASAMASAAQAVLAGYTQQPFLPTGLAAGTLALGLGTIQTAAVAEQKPQPPSMATGGVVFPSSGGTLTRQAENGYPEVDVNMGDSGKGVVKMLAQEIARQIGDKNVQHTINIPIYLDGRQIATNTAYYYNNGIVRLKK